MSLLFPRGTNQRLDAPACLVSGYQCNSQASVRHESCSDKRHFVHGIAIGDHELFLVRL